VTIAIHMWAGSGCYVTAADTQETYHTGEKTESGKIVSASRMKPMGAINISGAGDSFYITALSQGLVRAFQAFKGGAEGLDARLRHVVRAFYNVHVLPHEGRLQDENVPNYLMLVSTQHQGVGKLWSVHRTSVTESNTFDSVGTGKPTADALLMRLFPQYPNLDSVALLAAYIIYRVKASVSGCGLRTEIRYIYRNVIGLVSDDLIDRWEAVFSKYDRINRGIFYHAMNFPARPPAHPVKEMQERFEQTFVPQMKPLPEIVSEIEAMREELEKIPKLLNPIPPSGV
jgi:hypothetical protein